MNTIRNINSNLRLITTHSENELRSIFKDRGALLILIGAMLIYPIIYSIGYVHETMSDLPIAVVDLDRTVTSQKYASMLDASSEVEVSCKPNNLHKAEKLFLANKINGVVLIPSGFQEEVFSGKQANVAVYADASYFLKYKNTIMAISITNAYFNGGIALKRYMAEGKSFEQAKISHSPLSVQTHILYNPASAYGTFIMPGMILIIIQQTLLIGIGLIGGSFSESKASPFLLPLKERGREVIPYLMGKSGAYLLISFLNVALAVVLIHDWFSYPDKGSMLDVMILLLPYLLSVIFLGIGLSTLFVHRESAIVFMVFLSPLALFFSGLSWPVSAMPDWLAFISKAMPSTSVVPAYLRIRTMGAGLSEIKSELIQLYLQAGVYLLMTTTYFFFHVRANKKPGLIPVNS